MELSEYQNIYKAESSHFFYKANHEILLRLVKQYVPKEKNLKILDAGCGTGLLSKKLQKFGQVTGVDFHPEAVKFTRSRGVDARQASVTKLPFKDNLFDLVVSMDVIYHKSIKNDIHALKEFARVLKPNGVLILRVPANKCLHLRHDRYVHTRERYDKNELKLKLKKGGFDTQLISYTNGLLLPLAALKQAFEAFGSRSQVESGVAEVPSAVNTFLTQALMAEWFFIKNGALPFGLGLVAVAQKMQPHMGRNKKSF